MIGKGRNERQQQILRPGGLPSLRLGTGGMTRGDCASIMPLLLKKTFASGVRGGLPCAAKEVSSDDSSDDRKIHHGSFDFGFSCSGFTKSHPTTHRSAGSNPHRNMRRRKSNCGGARGCLSTWTGWRYSLHLDTRAANQRCANAKCGHPSKSHGEG